MPNTKTLEHITNLFQLPLGYNQVAEIFTGLGYEPNFQTLDSTLYKPPNRQECHIAQFTQIAKFGRVKVLYLEIDHPSMSFEREVVRKIIRDYPDCLIFLTYSSQSVRFAYLIHPLTISNYPILQRFRIEGSKPRKNAVERLDKLQVSDMDTDDDLAQRIRQIFDLRALTDQFSRAFRSTYHKIRLSLNEHCREHSMDVNHIPQRLSLQMLNRLIIVECLQTQIEEPQNQNFLVDKFKSYLDSKSGQANFYQSFLQPLFFDVPDTFERSEQIEQDEIIEFLESIEHRKNLLYHRTVENYPFFGYALFEPNQLDLLDIIIDDTVISEIIEFLKGYQFSIGEHTSHNYTISVNPEMVANAQQFLISEQERAQAGIYYTSKVEVEYMCQLALFRYLESKAKCDREILQQVIFDPNHQIEPSLAEDVQSSLCDEIEDLIILDPSAGTGAFLIGMAQLLTKVLSFLKPNQPVKTIKLHILQHILHGIDIKQSAITMTRYRLWLWLISDLLEHKTADWLWERTNQHRSTVEYYGTLPDMPSNLYIGDALLLSHSGDTRGGMSERIVMDTLSKIKLDNDGLFEDLTQTWTFEKLTHIFNAKDGFDIIIGNPPYVRSEDIIPPTMSVRNMSTVARRKLAAHYKKQLADHIANLIPEYRHNSKQDYYIYFIYLGQHLLNTNGVLAFVTSDSWMNMTYGFELQEYLTQHTRLIEIVTNLSERSFTAQVNTCITVLQSVTGQPWNHLSRFVALLEPYRETILDSQVGVALLNLDGDHETSQFRIRVRNQANLHNSDGMDILFGSESDEFLAFKGSKWGSILFRTPFFFTKLLKSVKTSSPVEFRELKDCKGLEVLYGNKTGFTNFFFPSLELIDKFDLPETYLKPSLKSPKGFTGLSTTNIDPTIQGNQILLIPPNHKYPSALTDYITFAETNTSFNRAHPPQQRPSLKWGSSTPWFCLPVRTPIPKILVPRFTYDSFRVIYNDASAHASDAFYYIETGNRTVDQIKAFLAILNSNFIGIMTELYGRVEGAGVLQVLKWEIQKFVVPDIDLLDSEQVRILGSLFDQLDEATEVTDPGPFQSTRVEIDKILLRLLGSDKPDERAYQLSRYYRQLVNNRLRSGSGQ